MFPLLPTAINICHLLFTLAGGFSEMYAVLCDYSGIPLREEIQWVRQNTKEEISHSS